MDAIFQDDPNIAHPERSILTIYVRSESFSFSLYNPEESGSYFYRELTGESQPDSFSVFKEVFFGNDFFSLPFRKVWIMNHTPRFTFIPNSIYKEKYRENFMHFLFSNQQGITLNHSVSSAGITILHQFSEEVYNFMLRSFSKPEFIHYSAPFITHFLEESKKMDNRRMIVNLQKAGVDIFCFAENIFLFGNYFPCNNLQEALYYILFTWKQLHLDQRNDCLYVEGNAVFKDELISKLTLYIQQIQNISIPLKIYFEGIDINRIPVELATLSLCE
jgi:hypothetical protein